jgi:hypothetical protein
MEHKRGLWFFGKAYARRVSKIVHVGSMPMGKGVSCQLSLTDRIDIKFLTVFRVTDGPSTTDRNNIVLSFPVGFFKPTRTLPVPDSFTKASGIMLSMFSKKKRIILSLVVI